MYQKLARLVPFRDRFDMLLLFALAKIDPSMGRCGLVHNEFSFLGRTEIYVIRARVCADEGNGAIGSPCCLMLCPNIGLRHLCQGRTGRLPGGSFVMSVVTSSFQRFTLLFGRS